MAPGNGYFAQQEAKKCSTCKGDGWMWYCWKHSHYADDDGYCQDCGSSDDTEKTDCMSCSGTGEKDTYYNIMDHH